MALKLTFLQMKMLKMVSARERDFKPQDWFSKALLSKNSPPPLKLLWIFLLDRKRLLWDFFFWKLGKKKKRENKFYNCSIIFRFQSASKNLKIGEKRNSVFDEKIYFLKKYYSCGRLFGDFFFSVLISVSTSFSFLISKY